MHEMGLAEGIVAAVEEVVGDRPVQRIGVCVGSAQAVTGDSLEFNFTLLTEGTAMETTHLDVTHVAGDGVRVDEIVLAGGDVVRPRDLMVAEAHHGGEGQHTHPAWL